MNEIIKSIYERKSVRAYEDRSIPEEMKQVMVKRVSHLQQDRRKQYVRE